MIRKAILNDVNDIHALFTLTYRPTFFEQFGFTVIDKKDLPIKVWSDCIGCARKAMF